MFFFNDTATTEIYTLALHDALPIYRVVPEIGEQRRLVDALRARARHLVGARLEQQERWLESVRSRPVLADRKSTRLNSSHANISYAVFCLKNKKHRRPALGGSQPHQ